MAAPTTLPALLDSLTQSLTSAQEAIPKVSELEKPKDGISLLDVKNELLLSYLQNLVFLILLKIRNSKQESSEDKDEIDEVVRSKLVELRLYLEKGARPLEEKLRFSIERFLRTAQDAQAKERQRLNAEEDKDSNDSESGSEEDEDSEDGGDGDGAVESRSGKRSAAPNLGAMTDDVTARASKRGEDGPSGVYRPPKRERQLMETGQRRDKGERRAAKSQTMDEFVADELSAAPLAVPSIGTTIVQGGRRMKSEHERKDEAERQTYEESNFVRLPQLSKKDRAKKNKQAGKSGRMDFGGEEWHNLGQGIERIDRLTQGKDKGRGGNVRSMLEKSRKRGIDTTDGPRDSGMGERFQKRVRVLDSGRRDRGKNR